MTLFHLSHYSMPRVCESVRSLVVVAPHRTLTSITTVLTSNTEPITLDCIFVHTIPLLANAGQCRPILEITCNGKEASSLHPLLHLDSHPLACALNLVVSVSCRSMLFRRGVAAVVVVIVVVMQQQQRNPADFGAERSDGEREACVLRVISMDSEGIRRG